MTNSDFIGVMADGLGDWRFESVSTVAEDSPYAPAGSAVRLMNQAKHKQYRYLSFVTPSPTALALNVALRSAVMAEVMRPRFATTEMRTHTGERGFMVRDECLADLYYFFEQAMITATMSFQALELFANAIIGRRATGKVRVKRKQGEIELSPAQAERQLSTEEKFGQVLPSVLNVPSPVGNRTWQRFKRLKSSRDSTVHLKSVDMFTRNQVDRESLFFHFLNTDCREYPGDAIKVIAHYLPGNKKPRWLRHAEMLLKCDSQADPF